MAGEQWYLAIGGQQVGPITEEEVARRIQAGAADGNTFVFGPGMTDWTPLKDVPRLAANLGGPRVGAPPPPPRQAHEIDFKILGSEMQFVEIALDPGESAVAEAGAMMFMTNGVSMETVF